MDLNRKVASLAMLGLVAGCGVSKSQLESKSLEAENYRRQYGDEAEKVKALEAKVAQLNEELASLRKDRARSDEALAQAREELEKKSSQYEQLSQSLKEEIKAGKIELSELKGRTVVKMKDRILFSSGSVAINPEGQAALAKVAQALKDVQGKLVRVEGHTDDVPTDPKGPFPSNWELSTTRALAVVRLLQEQGVSADKLSAAGYGEYRPIASNKSPQGKSLNRRIEIVLAPEDQAPGIKNRSASR
ncbi:OmpA family protein [Pyxidicoccus parkwayensis]|uniref:OmpA family protein n=1 Tax=Pyxidicoccus parkwayensis TaxID=2813578 RepID=A0ABX7P5N6_9BACT|nr:OmpA family protein [Pyxidicoccus parkwaysis]QSQ25790.1 OmpA family protein [Pyxidicoccus parkwaysis]